MLIDSRLWICHKIECTSFLANTPSLHKVLCKLVLFAAKWSDAGEKYNLLSAGNSAVLWDRERKRHVLRCFYTHVPEIVYEADWLVTTFTVACVHAAIWFPVRGQSQF